MTFVRWLVSLPLRILAAIAGLLAVLAGAHDAWRSWHTGELVLTQLGALWFELSAETLNLLQAGIQRGVHPALWDPGVVFLLQRPAVLSLLLVAGVALILARLIYRPKRRTARNTGGMAQ